MDRIFEEWDPEFCQNNNINNNARCRNVNNNNNNDDDVIGHYINTDAIQTCDMLDVSLDPDFYELFNQISKASHIKVSSRTRTKCRTQKSDRERRKIQKRKSYTDEDEYREEEEEEVLKDNTDTDKISDKKKEKEAVEKEKEKVEEEKIEIIEQTKKSIESVPLSVAVINDCPIQRKGPLIGSYWIDPIICVGPYSPQINKLWDIGFTRIICLMTREERKKYNIHELYSVAQSNFGINIKYSRISPIKEESGTNITGLVRYMCTIIKDCNLNPKGYGYTYIHDVKGRRRLGLPVTLFLSKMYKLKQDQAINLYLKLASTINSEIDNNNMIDLKRTSYNFKSRHRQQISEIMNDWEEPYVCFGSARMTTNNNNNQKSLHIDAEDTKKIQWNVFSPKYKCIFSDDKYTYNSVQQYMLTKQAFCMHEDELAIQIISTSDLNKQQLLIYSSNLNVLHPKWPCWISARDAICLNGNLLKFCQNINLLEILISTRNKEIIYLSTNNSKTQKNKKNNDKDKTKNDDDDDDDENYWTIGMTSNQFRYNDRSLWMGENTFGKQLVKTRESCRARYFFRQAFQNRNQK